uniref:Gustatory receptor n=1 Tax=Glossina palpalis gambiensis TaxID=67801 RepID=A0A1B0B2A4_9MUSC
MKTLVEQLRNDTLRLMLIGKSSAQFRDYSGKGNIFQFSAGDISLATFLIYVLKIIITFGLIMLLIYEVKHFYGQWFFIPLMVTTYPYSAATVMLLQFAYYVYEISKRHQTINHFLEQINRDINKTPKGITLEIFNIETELKIASSENVQLNERHVKQTTHRSEENDYNDDSMQSLESRTNYATTASLTKLFKLFDSVLSLSVLTNNEYGPHCVPYMSASFVITIFCIFFQIKIYHVVGGKSRLLDYIVFMYLLWSFVTMLVTYIVLCLCCNASGEAKQTAVIVQEIMRKRPAFMLGADGNYNEMKSFLLQSLHWKEYFQYNAIGLFPLDYTLIFTMISAATSYLIVLLQVDISSILQTEGLL